MTDKSPKKIAVISMARNDSFFVSKWISYYGSQFGVENLFLIIDGHDQPIPEGHKLINILRLPHLQFSRAKGDRNRARLVSFFARSLFHRYDIIIAHDIDEFLVIDPDCGQTLSGYLQRSIRSSSLSALGLDVGQHLKSEGPINFDQPFLEQRKYAHVSARYTKSVVATRPLTWGSGFHRVKGRNFHIDPNLYLFHFGMVDFEHSRKKMDDHSLLEVGWEAHLDRRYELFDLISTSKPLDGDEFFRKARRRQTLIRPIFAINKPGMLREKPVIRIPDRFSTIV